MTLKAALDALRDDAGMWTDVSDVLTTARGSCSSLTLSAHQLTGMADREGLVSLYDEVRTTVAGLLAQGGTNTDAISDALIDVRRQYQEDDEAARARLAGAWEPK